jgi:hypothetical protein
MRRSVPALFFLFASVLAACSPEPRLSGDQVAVVNDVVVTKEDLDLEEWMATPDSSSAVLPEPTRRRMAFDRLVERSLLAGAARRRGIAPVESDPGRAGEATAPPEGVDPGVWRRRVEEDRLARAYLRRIIGDRVRLCDADMTAWMRQHPEQFADSTFEEVREWLAPFMMARQESAATRAHLDRLRRRARITVTPVTG